MALAVTGNNFIKSCTDGEILSVRPRGHIRIQQRVGYKRRLARKRLEAVGKAALLCLDVRASVMGDERTDAIFETGLAQPDGSIERMKACVANIRRVAYVVQPRRCFKNVGVRACKQYVCQPCRFARNPFHMKPSLGERHLKMATRYLLGSIE